MTGQKKGGGRAPGNQSGTVRPQAKLWLYLVIDYKKVMKSPLSYFAYSCFPDPS